MAPLVAAILVVFSGCGGVSGNGGGADTYRHRVVIEKITGTWCGFCPDGVEVIEEITAQHTEVIPIAYHSGDAFSTTGVTTIIDTLHDYGGVPAAMVQRIPYYDSYYDVETLSFSRSYWASAVENARRATAQVGIGIASARTDDNATVDVTVYRSEKTDAAFHLTVVLIENGIVTAHANYYNDDPDSAYYGRGNPIPDFELNHVTREVLSAPLGDALSTGVPAETKSYNVTLDPAWDPEKLKLVAFVHYNEPARRTIINGQKVALGGSVAAD